MSKKLLFIRKNLIDCGIKMIDYIKYCHMQNVL